MRVRDLSPGPPIAHLTPFKRNGVVIGYVTNFGLGGDGKRRRRFFKDRDQAEQFLNEHARTTFDPLHGRRNEVMFSLERVDRIGVSLHEVVEFYVLHGAKKSNPLLTDAINQFLDHKRLIGRGWHYFDRMGVVLHQLVQFVGDTAKVGDVSTDQIRRLVYVAHAHTSPVRHRGGDPPKTTHTKTTAGEGVGTLAACPSSS
jgi:hypothetical protein